MRKILIISPHFPPSNLAAVHRSRLFAQHLPTFGWSPIILMIDEKFYEETLDYNLVKLLPENLRIEKTSAFGLTRPRLIGDIGLRGFVQLYRKAKKIIEQEKIDFLYIPIPSFYIALLGRWLHTTTNVKYGIDYIDPWVHVFPGSNKLLSRHWVSTILAKKLEPIAVKKAVLITGVAEGYYKGVQERNPHLLQTCVFGAMPYGGEKEDYKMVRKLGLFPFLFTPNPEKIQMVYAGAMLPKAFEPLRKILEAIRMEAELCANLEIHFIGTGKTPDDPEGFNIKPLAEEFGLWNKVIYEYPKRISYLDVLVHLSAATGIFILGSTEKHYTPSKVFQGILSEKPLLAVLHREATAYELVRETGAGICCQIIPENLDRLKNDFISAYKNYLVRLKEFEPSQVKMEVFNNYSAAAVTKQLAELLKHHFHSVG